jgi:hypothetical protein
MLARVVNTWKHLLSQNIIIMFKLLLLSIVVKSIFPIHSSVGTGLSHLETLPQAAERDPVEGAGHGVPLRGGQEGGSPAQHQGHAGREAQDRQRLRALAQAVDGVLSGRL